jgi:hypothetical protein
VKSAIHLRRLWERWRETPSASQIHRTGQTPPVLRNKTELHFDSFAK